MTLGVQVYIHIFIPLQCAKANHFATLQYLQSSNTMALTYSIFLLLTLISLVKAGCIIQA
jgi:hypothetical protein